MLWMIIERFKPDSTDLVGQRFQTQGRMLPEEVEYLSSWLTPDGSVCYQLMRSPSRALIDVWVSRWSDLVEFEITQVETSEAYWSQRNRN